MTEIGNMKSKIVKTEWIACLMMVSNGFTQYNFLMPMTDTATTFPTSKYLTLIGPIKL